MNRWLGLGFLLILAGAWALRYPQLDTRPMHNDEAVNAIIIQKLWQDGLYKYNPDEYHGPTLHYAALPFIWLSGVRDFNQLQESTLRLAPVFFGLVLILLLWLLGDGLGTGATLSAGTLLAISPAMVFYSRYFIHEMLLVCFTMLVLAAGWRYSRTRHISGAVLIGMGVGLMYATKETFVIPLAAMVLAIVLTGLWNRFSHDDVFPTPYYWNLKHSLGGVLAGGLVSVAFFTSFFTNAAGPWDSLLSYLPWLNRAGGASPHIHPPLFYLERLAFFHPVRGPAWSEGLILFLAVAGLVAVITRKGLGSTNLSLARFLALYTVILTVAYSAISYKTPWCMLGFLQGMILLAGLGAVALVRAFDSWFAKLVIGLLLLAAAGHLGWQAWRASYVFAADRRNPYVYAQTVPNVLKLVQEVKAIAKADPDGNRMLIKVMAPTDDYWPLPWYLREFQQIGYWSKVVDTPPLAPVMIVSSKFEAALDEKTNKKWLMVGLYELRPEVFFELYVQYDLWKKYLESRPPPPKEEE